MVFLGSPLTALLAQTRLRGFLKSLVPKSVIASRNVLVDLLQVVAANNHGRPNVKTPLVLTSEPASSIGARRFAGQHGSSSPDDAASSEDDEEEKPGEDLSLFSSVSHENALTPGGFVFLMPILVETLIQTDPAAPDALRVLARQVFLQDFDSTAVEFDISQLLEGLFTCLYRVPRLHPDVLEALRLICRKLVRKDSEVVRLGQMVLQLSGKARNGVLVPSLMELANNPNYGKNMVKWEALLHAPLLLIKFAEAELSTKDRGSPEDAAVLGVNPDADTSILYHAFGPPRICEKTYEDLLDIVSAKLPVPCFESVEIQKLAVKGLIGLLHIELRNSGQALGHEKVKICWEKIVGRYSEVKEKHDGLGKELAEKREELAFAAPMNVKRIQNELDGLEIEDSEVLWPAKVGSKS